VIYNSPSLTCSYQQQKNKELHGIKHFSFCLTCGWIRQNFPVSFGHQLVGHSKTATQRAPMHHGPAEVKAQISILLCPKKTQKHFKF
jgi:hypothetical protein